MGRTVVRSTLSSGKTAPGPHLAGLVLLLCLAAGFLPGPLAADTAWQGRSLVSVLNEARASGLPLVYSSSLVSDTLIVESEPRSGDPIRRLNEALETHGLVLKGSGDAWYVVRIEQAPEVAMPIPESADSGEIPELEPLELEELSISASRYVLFTNSQFFIDQRAIQALPDLGEDPVRSAHRLPGSAAGGLSSRSHFRGGEHNETAIYLNGLKLLDPFHIRDYHSIFSSIDARAIAGVEAYTGGFPAHFGDQMSGVLLLDTRLPEEPLHTEIGLSVYNTTLLNSGHSEGGKVDWLVSARSSNLDLILNEDLGKPDYFDVFAEIGIALNDRHRLAFNALYADDQVEVITESDPEELEFSASDTLNRHFWVSLESQWTPKLSGTSVLSYSGLDNARDAEVNDPERLFARVSDVRDAELFGFQQNFRLDSLAGHTIRFGFELKRAEARYAYHSLAEYREFFEAWPGIRNPVASEIRAAPEGNSYSLFLSDRWQITPSTGLEAGLRWDKQTYTDPEFGSELSPRLSLLHSPDDDTDLRFTWGRYSQSQAIHELQVEDGLDRFFRPQRADHWIAGIQRRLGSRYRLRAEAYFKDYRRLKPRFENLFDPLALIPELAPDRVRLDPLSASAKGIELTLEYRNQERLDAWASYAWSKVTDRIGERDEPRSWDQRHAFQAGLAWRPGPWEIGLALSVHTGWPTTGVTLGVLPAPDGEEAGDEDDEEGDRYFPIPGPRNAERLGTFAQFDFRVSRHFDVRYGRLSAFFEVTNASNRKNECCVDYDLDEDEDGNVFLDRTVEHWLPIIPAVGILWEF
jgi:outer membrane receptor protein involved in Fe transport